MFKKTASMVNEIAHEKDAISQSSEDMLEATDHASETASTGAEYMQTLISKFKNESKL